MKKTKLKYFLIGFIALISLGSSKAQLVDMKTTNQGFYISANVGYDLPNFTKEYTYYEVQRGPKVGIGIGYNLLNGMGFGIDYDFITNKPHYTLSDGILYDSISNVKTPLVTDALNLQRHFIGIGPQYSRNFGRIGFQVYGRFGIGLLKGGDLVAHANNPTTNAVDHHLLFTGYKGTELSYKLGGKLYFSISDNFDVSLGAYHLRYFSVTPDRDVDLNNIGDIGIVYGSSPILQAAGGNRLGQGDALVVREATCSACSSTGIELGMRYRFEPKKIKEEVCSDCECPNDTHKVVVTVEDGPSGKVIAGSDVAITDIDGNIIASGATNSFGVIDFGAIPHGNYAINGKVLEIETSSSNLLEDEFLPGSIIQKKILYEDLRFILKGRTINNRSQAAESNVVVNLTNKSTQSVEQANSDGKGEFAFRIDRNSSYELVGIKENRLSDIDHASTIGLTRSTTLFVELKLGMDNFDCGQGTVLDIKYEYDMDALLPESKFELDRLVRYMNDHNVAKVELSSHTDARGSDEYNQDLSQRRAQSAVNYITSKNIARNRIIAFGYGETRLLNQCDDGVNCSDEEHRTNRRTEAKLLCK